jgi:membrane-associated phospholipid phosphatase
LNLSSTFKENFAEKRISKKDILVVSGITLLYLLLCKILIGLKSDHIFLAALFNVLYYASNLTRRFVLAFSIFIVYWIIFDFMKAFPNYNFGTVHIESLYKLEKSLFGFDYKGTRVTPNEYFGLNTTVFTDVLTGIFYLCWIPVPLAFGTYLFFKNRNLFFRFSLTFFLTNLLGFVVYYSFPAAAPWYMHLYGNNFEANTPGNIAGLAGFDKYFGVTVFASLYAKGSNVFAAMPSLHSAYPVIVVYYSLKTKLPVFVKILLAIVMVGIWFSAVYTSHHYMLDVLAGITCAIFGIALFNYLLKKKWLQNFVATLMKATN